MNPLPEQDVRDFISKLSMESTKVLVTFFNIAMGISVTLPGVLRLSTDGSITVSDASTPRMTETAVFSTSLDALLAVPQRGFADRREFFTRAVAAPPGFDKEVPIDFTLGFTFPNGSILVLSALRDAAT